MSDARKGRLNEIRAALLDLHKALVVSERASYEKTVGPIQSSTRFLNLLTSDPWFAWLQPVSHLIVTIDERMESDEPLTDAMVESTIQETRTLLAPSEDGQGFARHYFEALQADADVVITHSDLMQVLGKLKPNGQI